MLRTVGDWGWLARLEQMGVGEGAPGGGWGGSVISGSRWEIITSTTRAQITFCGIESLTAKCLLKVIEAEGRGQEEGGRGLFTRQHTWSLSKPDLFRCA